MDDVTVLVVEDMPVIQALVSRTVRQLLPSSRVITANNGEEGFLRANMVRPELIITGLVMPHMNGYEMVRLLRQEKIGKVTLIIGLSGDDPHSPLTRAFRAACDDFLAKPFAPRELQAKVKKVLDLKRSSLTTGPAPGYDDLNGEANFNDIGS